METAPTTERNGMREIQTEIEIRSAPERVWRVLSDLREYPRWNPFVIQAEGELRKGGRLEVRLQAEGRSPMRFRPTVEVVEPGRELRWIGHLGLRGLFDGRHRFVIEPTDVGRVRFVQSEQFSGILVGLVMRSALLEATRKGFDAMNRALKQQAEAPV